MPVPYAIAGGAPTATAEANHSLHRQVVCDVAEVMHGQLLDGSDANADRARAQNSWTVWDSRACASTNTGASCVAPKITRSISPGRPAGRLLQQPRPPARAEHRNPRHTAFVEVAPRRGRVLDNRRASVPAMECPPF